MAPRKASALGLAAGLSVGALHTGITLWYRWPILMAAGAAPAARDTAELNRMVSEKLAAAAQGMIAGQAEAMRLGFAAMTGRLPPKRLPEASASIAHAALRPALRTVKANAKRLPRRKR
jgi:hypothetical protein